MAKFLSFKFLLDFIFAKTEHAQNAPVMKIIHVARFFYLRENIVTANISGYTVTVCHYIHVNDFIVTILHVPFHSY